MADTTSRQNSNMGASVVTTSSTSGASLSSSNPMKKQYISRENRKRHGTFLDSIVQDPSKEQKSVYDVIYETDDYFPWGKPGGGAPKIDNYGRTKTKLAGSLKWENSNAGEDRSPVRNYDILSGKSNVATVSAQKPKPASQAPVGVREMPHFNPRSYGPARYEQTPRAPEPSQIKPQVEPRISPVPQPVVKPVVYEPSNVSHFNTAPPVAPPPQFTQHPAPTEYQTARPFLPPLSLDPPMSNRNMAPPPPVSSGLETSPRLSFRAHPHFPFHKEKVQAVPLASAPAGMLPSDQRLEMSMLERQAQLRHQNNVLRKSDTTILTSNTMENRLFGRNQPSNDYPNFPFWFGRMGPNQLTPRSNRFYQQSAPVHMPSHQMQGPPQQTHHNAPTAHYWPSNNTFTSYSTNNLAF